MDSLLDEIPPLPNLLVPAYHLSRLPLDWSLEFQVPDLSLPHSEMKFQDQPSYAALDFCLQVSGNRGVIQRTGSSECLRKQAALTDISRDFPYNLHDLK